MLKTLYIKNFALIDSLSMDFQEGFSVITGETGAGKSIILGALSLILGQRADIKSLKKDSEKSIVEGVFDVSEYDFKDFCEENDIEYDPETYTLRREILPTGKSRAFINDSPVTITELKLLGELLIDIHSQHENLLLSNTGFQLSVVDTIANNKIILDNYKVTFREYKEKDKYLKEMKELIAKNKQEEEYLRFQLTNLQDANLYEEEQEELEDELKILEHAEEIKSTLYRIHVILSDDEAGVVLKLKEGLQLSNQIQEVYQKTNEISSRLESSYIDLRDLSSEMERFSGDIEFDKERLNYVQERLNIIYNLQNRYKLTSVSELIELRESLAAKLDKLEMSDEEIEKLEKALIAKKEEVEKKAGEITKTRLKASKILEKEIIERIKPLGMPNAKLECKITRRNAPEIMGNDNVEFLFSANKNMPLQPITQVASGGEVSRFMLCLKSVVAGAKALPTIIFDEVDTGVSGEISDKMGAIMEEFGKKMQVIAITHQPQIAAKGHVHYKVYKEDTETSTTTNLIRLTSEQRLNEIAGMLSGSKVTDEARQNAKVMLEKK